MKKVIGLGLLMLLVYCISLVANVPMRLLVDQLPLPKQVVLGQVNGSLWNGSLSSVTTPQLRLEQIHYDFKPLALLMGKVSYGLTFAGSSPLQGKATASYGFSGWQLDDSQVFIDADWALQQAQLPLPMNAEGELKVQIEHMSQGQAWCSDLNGQVVWKTPSLQTPIAKLEFAKITAPLSCEQGNIQLQVQHQDRQLNLSAKVLLKAQNWEAEGKLKAGADLPKMLSDNLRYIGKADGQGFYNFKQQGRL